MLKELEKEIQANKNPSEAEHAQRFFKTGKGEYGEGDIFLGLRTPTIKSLSKKYRDLDRADLQKLLDSKFHEYRTIALVILTDQYAKSKNKEEIVNFYLDNTRNINNWDLVDISSYKIVGDYLLKHKNKNYDVLKKLSKSKSLWERRIAIVSTMVFVKSGELAPTLEISRTLLKNEHDLINKAVGWLLREVGKKNDAVLEKFLVDNIKDISSVTLSYSMEKFDKERKERIRKLR